MASSLPSQDLPVGGPGTPPIVLLRGIAKYFPGVIANADVDLEVRRGEIHALLGENGAGKSTLMNILTGIYQPDAGEIIIDGYATSFASPVEAIAAGIGMVHQHFKLVQAFTVAENVHLGWSETPRRASAAQLEARTRTLAERFNLDVRPDARVSDLSAGEQQRVEILRVLARQARVLILDEPTAVLTPAEARELFKALREFRARGNAVIFISHKLDEVLEISDRISVLRGGRKVATERHRRLQPSHARHADGRAGDRARQLSQPVGASRMRREHPSCRSRAFLRSTTTADPPFATSISTFGRAKSSASPASPATANASSARS